MLFAMFFRYYFNYYNNLRHLFFWFFTLTAERYFAKLPQAVFDFAANNRSISRLYFTYCLPASFSLR